MSDPQLFLVGHATHPDWRAALAMAVAQVSAAETARAAAAHAAPPLLAPLLPLSLGFVYYSDHYAAHAQALVSALQQRWPAVHWVGSVGVGVAALGVEYIDEPALVLMLAPLPAHQFEVFSGAHKLQRIEPFSALVHADPSTPDLAELIAEMSGRTQSGYLFGGLAGVQQGPGGALHGPATHVADGVWQGGLSGVAFAADVALLSRVTQGCQALGPTRVVTACEGNSVLQLDGQPALPLLLADLGLLNLDDPKKALPRLRATLVGLTDEKDSALPRAGHRAGGKGGAGSPFGTDTRVRHLVGLDAVRQAVAVADRVGLGMRLAFCQRDAQAARRDLVRICSEIREELEAQTEPALVAAGHGAGPGPEPEHKATAPRRIVGAVYVSCAGRGGPHFGGPSAELKIVQHALAAARPADSLGQSAEVPLVGFFAGGEIARHHLYGYTGVLTVFTAAG